MRIGLFTMGSPPHRSNTSSTQSLED